MVNVMVKAMPVTMELGTGAAVSIMSEKKQQEMFSEAQL